MALKCPRTQTLMKEITLDGIKLDISEACGGVWLDNQEIKKIDEANEAAGDKLVDILSEYQPKGIDYDQRIHCPKCSSSVLMRHYYSPKRSIQIDTCPTCAGIWLDPGELSTLRELFKTEVERKAYGEAFAAEVAKEALGPELKRSQEELAKAQSFAKALRFICPSYYIEGKQPWGAF
ncbi:MAG: zf-TFIIB domain-containing protein [Bdellovibrionota bacterium]